MACGCGGSEQGGGCAGARPAVEVQKLAAVAESAPAPAQQEALLIASSEQEWPRLRVNGVSIDAQAIARELQYHPAASRDEAVYLASQALVLRELLGQRAAELGIAGLAQPGESEEEARLRGLLEREVQLPVADDDACRQYYAANRARFFSAPLLAVRHILLGCPPDDAEARSQACELGQKLLETLQQDAQRFAELALRHSACPSKLHGGALGQLSKGQTVPELERQLFRLPTGLCAQPLESRYGYHLVSVDRRIEGEQLPYEMVAASIRAELEQRVWQTAVSQYLQTLVGAARIEGIQMQGAQTPLLQ